MLELFLLKHKLMGPCWLNIKSAQQVTQMAQQHSWCKLEYKLSTPKKNITQIMGTSSLLPPPLTVMSINMFTMMNEVKKTNEILMISAICCKGGAASLQQLLKQVFSSLT